MIPRLKAIVPAVRLFVNRKAAKIAGVCSRLYRSPAGAWAVALGLSCYIAGGFFARPVVMSAAVLPQSQPVKKTGCKPCAAKAALLKAAALQPQPDPLSTPGADAKVSKDAH